MGLLSCFHQHSLHVIRSPLLDRYKITVHNPRWQCFRRIAATLPFDQCKISPILQSKNERKVRKNSKMESKQVLRCRRGTARRQNPERKGVETSERELNAANTVKVRRLTQLLFALFGSF